MVVLFKHTLKKEVPDKETNTTLWVWEFTKLFVCILLILFITGDLFAIYGSWYSFVKLSDTTPLTTFITSNVDMCRDCLVGYFVKATVENVFKNNWIGGVIDKISNKSE